MRSGPNSGSLEICHIILRHRCCLSCWNVVGKSRISTLCCRKRLANRITAAPGNSAYGRLSVMVQASSSVEPLIEVLQRASHRFQKWTRGGSDHPKQGKVHRIQCMDTLTHVVRQCFSQRRKTLRNNLKEIIKPEEFDYLRNRSAGSSGTTVCGYLY